MTPATSDERARMLMVIGDAVATSWCLWRCWWLTLRLSWRLCRRRGQCYGWHRRRCWFRQRQRHDKHKWITQPGSKECSLHVPVATCEWVVQESKQPWSWPIVPRRRRMGETMGEMMVPCRVPLPKSSDHRRSTPLQRGVVTIRASLADAVLKQVQQPMPPKA